MSGIKDLHRFDIIMRENGRVEARESAGGQWVFDPSHRIDEKKYRNKLKNSRPTDTNVGDIAVYENNGLRKPLLVWIKEIDPINGKNPNAHRFCRVVPLDGDERDLKELDRLFVVSLDKCRPVY